MNTAPVPSVYLGLKPEKYSFMRIFPRASTSGESQSSPDETAIDFLNDHLGLRDVIVDSIEEHFAIAIVFSIRSLISSDSV